MSAHSKIHLIGSAHLDPIWLWRWQEGCGEVLQTFRSALDRLNEYPDFVFTCSSAAYYKWVEEIAPDMFEEIVARVKEGRWVPVNGWWVQPDCNMPSGESFARQALYSQLYYYEKFGKICSTGYNVDSFGHNGNLPQLIFKGGMNAAEGDEVPGLPATGLHLRFPHLGHTQPPGKRRRMSASSHDPSSPYLATQDRRSPSPPSADSTILALGLAMPLRPFP